VTLADVAAHAGVSTATVSNVVRGSRGVSAPTRTRVELAIAELGYEPNAIARALKQQVSHTIGLIVPDTLNPFFAVLALGVERAARERGYAVLVIDSECRSETEAECVHVLVSRHVDAILFAGLCEGSWIYESILERGIPVSLASFALDDPRVGSVAIDDNLAIEAVVDHLSALGHRRLAFCRYGRAGAMGERREVSFARVVTRRGLELVGLHDRPTAVACHNDMVAIDYIHSLERRGLKVPRDVSVVGFDDIPMAGHHRIELTTVRNDGDAIGRRAAHLLLDAIERREPPTRREIVPAQLVVRGSTGPIADSR
jgi:LacI family transcriptional regulator